MQIDLGKFKGTDGQNCYIRYSAAEDGSGMQEYWHEGLEFIGFAMAKGGAPSDKAKYRWCRFVANSVKTSQIKQTTGTSSEDIMSQKAVTDAISDVAGEVADLATSTQDALAQKADKGAGYAHVGGGVGDYIHWVLPLVEYINASGSGNGLDHYFSGKVFAKRPNGTTAPMQIEFTAYSYYWGGYQFTGTKSAVNGDIVTFVYNGKRYIGVRYTGAAIYGAGVHLSGFWSGDMPFKLGIIPYYNTNTQAVLNAEVRDSIVVV